MNINNKKEMKKKAKINTTKEKRKENTNVNKRK